MVKPLFDTNILIDYLNGIDQARLELERYDYWEISIISWMEVMAGAMGSAQDETRRFLNNFTVHPIDDAVAELAVSLRQARKLKLPDAIIQATAGVHSLLLVTRNEKDFPDSLPGVRIPYRLYLPGLSET